MNILILYSTLGCHLCEQALDLITPLLSEGGEDCEIKEVDISGSDELVDRYGLRIPVVVRTDNNSEMGWPFDREQFLKFLN